MRLLLLVLLLVAVVLVLMGGTIAVLTWYYGHKNRSIGINKNSGQ